MRARNKNECEQGAAPRETHLLNERSHIYCSVACIPYSMQLDSRRGTKRSDQQINLSKRGQAHVNSQLQANQARLYKYIQ